MTLQECYAAFGGDYTGVLGRLMNSEKMVQKFALKFLDDPSYGLLCQAMETQDRETAFRASHTIKGVCQNLGFTTLYESSNALTEALRTDWAPNARQLADQVSADYRQVADALEAFRAQLEA